MSMLEALSSIGDLVIFGGCWTIVIITLWVYREGRLKYVEMAYPKLWRRGCLFIFLGGLGRLLSFLEFVGNPPQILQSTTKFLTAVVVCAFAVQLWRRRTELVNIGRVMSAIEDTRGERSS